jgi:glycine dehydrogenase subunit 1
MACNKKHIRQMPGRFVGETIDNNNKRAFTLTLSTREQHIRREKATSNICTNSGLCSLAFSIHLSLLGSKGLKTMAKIDHTNAIYLYKSLKNMGIKILNTSFYNEFVIEVPEQIKSSKEFINKMLKMDILAGIALNDFYTKDKKELENKLLITTTAIHSKEDLDKFIQAVAKLQSN